VLGVGLLSPLTPFSHIVFVVLGVSGCARGARCSPLGCIVYSSCPICAMCMVWNRCMKFRLIRIQNAVHEPPR
jgi:hypothetical protein